MRLTLIFVALVAFGFFIFQIPSLWINQRNLSEEFKESQMKLNEAKESATELKNELEYLSNPLNLEKELRSRFNLKKPGEKTIIIVPKNETSSPNESNN